MPVLRGFLVGAAEGWRMAAKANMADIPSASSMT
jgi:hypothetical protein